MFYWLNFCLKLHTSRVIPDFQLNFKKITIWVFILAHIPPILMLSWVIITLSKVLGWSPSLGSAVCFFWSIPLYPLPAANRKEASCLPAGLSNVRSF